MERRKAHPLVNVLFIAVCAVLSGAEGWNGIETFGRAKKRWLAGYLELPDGPHPVPSDDTYRRTISRLDPAAFEEVFRAWVASLAEHIEGEVIALDGKSLRGSRDRNEATLNPAPSGETPSDEAAQNEEEPPEHGAPQKPLHQKPLHQKPLHLVSAWACEQRLVLAQQAVDAKTNEITVLPDLLRMLELEGCLITIDAMGTQKAIAEQIHEQGGDYVLALKSNHPRLYGDVKTHFADVVDRGLLDRDSSHARAVDGGHGRVEVRECWATDDIAWLDRRDQWPGLQSIAMVEATRQEHRWDEEAGKRVWSTTTERRYYISSLPADAERIGTAVRAHWGIENRMHWVLDVSFSEDASRIRKRNGPENVSVLRRIAMNMIRQDERPGSLRQKRKRAGWDDEYREQILGI